MQKSATSYSLFLMMGTLIMLVPFTNLNISNVKAQEYGSYDYDVDDRYSQYPTEENKYECQTGPLEGFFVSSVEFCKFNKFAKDDNRDRDNNNQTGPQGLPGSQGPPGADGIDGEDGAQGPTRQKVHLE